MLTGGTFDRFDGHCDGQKWVCIPIFARQRNFFDGVVSCKQTFRPCLPVTSSSPFYLNGSLLFNIVSNGKRNLI